MIKSVCGFVFLLSISSVFAQDFPALRKQMVQDQLITKNIKDTLTLKAMGLVPRHEFVEQAIQDKAYDDGVLPIGDGQTISSPYIVAYMTQELQLRRKFRVLEVGTGSGYQAAVLAVGVDSVFTVEINENLGMKAVEKLKSLGYDNVQVRIGDGYQGWKEKGHFDAIIVTAAVEKMPQPLMDQLAEGGRMIIPIGDSGELQHLILAKKVNGKIMIKNRIRVRFVSLMRNKN